MKIKRIDGTVIAEDENKTVRELCKENKDDLHGANLRWANLYRADLYRANLYRANLLGADLRGADLHGANLRGANLYRADLHGANLYRADLHGANLLGADLRGADLHGANLRGANLRGANLHGAKLNWNSHVLLAELLMRAAQDDPEKLKVAAVVALGGRINWCWEDFEKYLPELREWRLEVYASHDNLNGAPHCVLDKAEEMKT